MLEDDLERQLGAMDILPRISIALNRDSLETWFLDLIHEKAIFSQIMIEMIADDQELTLNYLKNGVVSACLSTSSKEIIGGKVHFLGNMEYLLVAMPEFIRKYFSPKKQKQGFLDAPAVKFDQNDQLHERYLEKFFNLNTDEISFHIVPSVRGFKKFVLSGYGYALIPKIDIIEELKSQQLIPISDKGWNIPLYWHYWAVESKFYRKFNAAIIHQVKKKLEAVKILDEK